MSSSTRDRRDGVFARLWPTSGQEASAHGPASVVAGRPRRRPAVVWAGVALALASSVAFAALLAHAGRKVPVLVVARPVPVGAVVTSGDLRELELGVDDAVGHVVPTADVGVVVGRTAVVPLVAGAVLAPQDVGTGPAFPPVGQAQVSFAVEPGGLPAGVGAGQRVAVLSGVSGDTVTGQSGEQAQTAPVTPLVGTVTDVAAGVQDSGAVVTLLVDTAAAERAARFDKPHVVVLSPLSREVP